MNFNRAIVPAEGGNSGKLFAEFLRISSQRELDLTKMVSILFDRLYRLGMVRHVDGTRANRTRKREREAAKRRRKGEPTTKSRTKSRSKAKTRKAQPRRSTTRNTRRARPSRQTVRSAR